MTVNTREFMRVENLELDNWVRKKQSLSDLDPGFIYSIIEETLPYKERVQ